MKALKLLCLILALIFLAVGCEKKLTKPLELNKPIAPQESIQSLHEAVEKGNFSVVKDLISDGADVNTRGPFGSMPLHLAVREGHIKIAELLILNGADVNTKDWQGQPVLHIAV
ncbi:MAG: ankyrin repeat domain-containing protein, partial [Planctomycetota bacterium]